MKTITRSYALIFLLVLIVSICKAQTTVSGGIYTNTTWTLANSPYIADTVVVFPNVVLTIEAGVEVKVIDKIEIREAQLIAEGTLTDSITFIGDTLTGISVLFFNAHTSKINYCNFRNGIGQPSPSNGIGVYVRLYGPNDSMDIRNSYFYGNDRGIDIMSLGTVNVDSCLFEGNTSGIEPAYGTLTNSVFRLNETGISSANSAYIQNCIIDSNTVMGIDASGGGYGTTITGCQVTNNGIGLRVVSNSSSAILNNIHGNIIEDNNIGIQIHSYGSQDSIYCNKICNNTTYDLKMMNSFNSVAANNYWCTTDSGIIASHIYDGYDNASLGLVTFMPIDTDSCYLTGCNISIMLSVTNATCDTCHNGSATAAAGNGAAPYLYTWYTAPIQTMQTATGMSAGNYTICVSDANGCTACGNVYIDSSNCTGFAINANANNATCLTCNDGYAWVTVNGGAQPFIYTWYTGPIQTTDTATGLLQGTYIVCVTDVYGCSACDTVVVGTGNCSAHFDLYPDTSPHAYYAVNMASGVAPLTYSWNWGDGSPFDTLPYPSHTYANAGNYTICLTITDSVGCTNTYCNSYYLQLMPNPMIYVNVIPVGLAAIQEINDNKVLIFPNPASDYLSIQFPNNKSAGELKIFNVIGKLEYASRLSNSKTKVDVSALISGIHFIEVITATGISRVKFMKQ